MCGIIGYIRKQQATPILLEGLRRLEYRGYDSAGFTILSENKLLTRKKKGEHRRRSREPRRRGNLGEWNRSGAHPLGHARRALGLEFSSPLGPEWKDRGRPQWCHREYDRLKERMTDHLFHSVTDTEVLAHLIG